MGVPPPPPERSPAAPDTAAGECPSCGRPYAVGQEYCLGCGVRLPPATGVVPALAGGWRRRGRWYPGDWLWPALLGLLIAALGTTVAILATRDKERDTVVATSPLGTSSAASTGETLPTTSVSTPSATTPTATTPTTPTVAPPAVPAEPIDWPAGRSGYTVILASVPATSGRSAALAQARKAIAQGVTEVGVLDSAEYSTLHPGYFVVFAGVADTYAAAQTSLETAKTSGYESAYVRQITQ